MLNAYNNIIEFERMKQYRCCYMMPMAKYPFCNIAELNRLTSSSCNHRAIIVLTSNIKTNFEEQRPIPSTFLKVSMDFFVEIRMKLFKIFLKIIFKSFFHHHFHCSFSNNLLSITVRYFISQIVNKIIMNRYRNIRVKL